MSDQSPFHNRRGSIPPGTSPVTSFFQRRNSLAVSMAPPPLFTSPSAPAEPTHRRRMSVSASLGLASSPTGTFDYRRSSTSTAADSIDESAVEDDDRNPPALNFTRRMSVQPPRGVTGSMAGSPNTGNSPGSSSSGGFGFDGSSPIPIRGSSQAPPPQISNSNPLVRNQDQTFYDWSAHLRARAQSSVSGSRPVFGSPPRDSAPSQQVPKASDMPPPPVQATPPKPQRAKPDAYQERILKGDFYMD